MPIDLIAKCDITIKYKLVVEQKDRKIKQQLYSITNMETKKISEWIIDTRDKKFQKALIELGWTLSKKKIEYGDIMDVLEGFSISTKLGLRYKLASAILKIVN